MTSLSAGSSLGAPAEAGVAAPLSVAAMPLRFPWADMNTAEALQRAGNAPLTPFQALFVETATPAERAAYTAAEIAYGSYRKAHPEDLIEHEKVMGIVNAQAAATPQAFPSEWATRALVMSMPTKKDGQPRHLSPTSNLANPTYLLFDIDPFTGAVVRRTGCPIGVVMHCGTEDAMLSRSGPYGNVEFADSITATRLQKGGEYIATTVTDDKAAQIFALTGRVFHPTKCIDVIDPFFVAARCGLAMRRRLIKKLLAAYPTTHLEAAKAATVVAEILKATDVVGVARATERAALAARSAELRTESDQCEALDKESQKAFETGDIPKGTELMVRTREMRAAISNAKEALSAILVLFESQNVDALLTAAAIEFIRGNYETLLGNIVTDMDQTGKKTEIASLTDRVPLMILRNKGLVRPLTAEQLAARAADTPKGGVPMLHEAYRKLDFRGAYAAAYARPDNRALGDKPLTSVSACAPKLLPMLPVGVSPTHYTPAQLEAIQMAFYGPRRGPDAQPLMQTRTINGRTITTPVQTLGGGNFLMVEWKNGGMYRLATCGEYGYLNRSYVMRLVENGWSPSTARTLVPTFQNNACDEAMLAMLSPEIAEMMRHAHTPATKEDSVPPTVPLIVIMPAAAEASTAPPAPAAQPALGMAHHMEHEPRMQLPVRELSDTEDEEENEEEAAAAARAASDVGATVSPGADAAHGSPLAKPAPHGSPLRQALAVPELATTQVDTSLAHAPDSTMHATGAREDPMSDAPLDETPEKAHGKKRREGGSGNVGGAKRARVRV